MILPHWDAADSAGALRQAARAKRRSEATQLDAQSSWASSEPTWIINPENTLRIFKKSCVTWLGCVSKTIISVRWRKPLLLPCVSSGASWFMSDWIIPTWLPFSLTWLQQLFDALCTWQAGGCWWASFGRMYTYPVWWHAVLEPVGLLCFGYSDLSWPESIPKHSQASCGQLYIICCAK